MAELTAPPGFRLVTRRDQIERHRRWVPTSADGKSGYFTTQSVEEEAEAAARQAAEKAVILASALARTPAALAEAEAQREAAAAARFAEQWPNGPRAGLRQAHVNLRESESDLARRQEVFATALAHCSAVAARQTELEGTKSVDDERLVRAIRESIEGGQQIPASSESDVDRELASVRQDFEFAERVCFELAATVREAEAAIRSCRRRIGIAALAVIEEARKTAESELRAAEQVVEGLISRVISLRVDSRYGSSNWPAPLKALLSDPEAEI
jgi:hypothetical protein